MSGDVQYLITEIRPCPECHGRGWIPDADGICFLDCPVCPDSCGEIVMETPLADALRALGVTVPEVRAKVEVRDGR